MMRAQALSAVAVLCGLSAAGCQQNSASLNNPLKAPSIVNLTITPPLAAPGGLMTVSVVATSQDGFPVNYAWKVPSGWTAIGDLTTDVLVLTAPTQFASTGHLGLTVDDGHGKSSTTDILIGTASDAAPVAAISVNPSDPRVGLPVSLTSQVSVAFGQTATYQWTLNLVPTGSSAALTLATASATSFTPDLAGTYEATLVVTDANGVSGPKVSATVVVGYAAPVILSAEAAPAVAPPGGTVVVTAEAVSADGYPVSYSWTVPHGWSASGGTESSTLTLTAPPALGQSAQVILTAADGHGASASTVVTVATGSDMAPTAVVTVTPTDPVVGGLVALTAQVSTSYGQQATEAWSLIDSPRGSNAILEGDTSLTFNCKPDLPGTYIFQLVVTDQTGLSSGPIVTEVTVKGFSPPAIQNLTATPPVAQPGGTITLAASASSTDGYSINYSWKVPPTWTVLGATNTNALVVIAPTQFGISGEVTLTVDDGHGQSVSETVALSTASDVSPVAGITASTDAAVVGVPVSFTSFATTTDGQPATYLWSLAQAPVGSLAVLDSTTGSITSFVPDLPGTYEVALVVTDAAGLTSVPATAVVVATYGTVLSISLEATPIPPLVKQQESVQAQVSGASGSTVTYDWSFARLPIGSAATLSGTSGPIVTFTPDLVGVYAVQLIVTDGDGNVSAPAVVTLTAQYPPPVPFIVLPVPQGQTIGLGLESPLDGSKSTDPLGNPLSYAWSITMTPSSQSGCGGLECLSSGSGAIVQIRPDVTGNYTVQLTVTDTVTNVSASTTATVGGFPIAIPTLTGDGQVGVVHQELANPLVVTLQFGDPPQPLANAKVVWTIDNGVFNQVSSLTDAIGQAVAVVTLGRVAGPVQVTASYGSNQGTMFRLTAMPDVPASLAVRTLPGTVDGSTTFSVTEVDQFGNATTANTAANSAQVLVTLFGGAGSPQFVPNVMLNVLGGSPASAVATLVNGTFTGTITDTTAETMHVNITRASAGAPLPFSAWTTLLRDGAETGMSKWMNTGGSPPWDIENQLVQDGRDAFQILWDPAQQATNNNIANLYTNAALSPPSGSTVTLLTYQQNIVTSGVIDTQLGCMVQPAFRTLMATSPTNILAALYAEPVLGWGSFDACFTQGPTFNGGTGWSGETVDLTDDIAAGDNLLVFQAINNADTDVAATTVNASWTLDDIWVQSLGTTSFAGNTASLLMSPGVATGVQFFPAVSFGQCLSGAAPYLVNVEVVDQYGNPALGSPVIEVDWSGATGIVNPAATAGTILSIVQNGSTVGAQVQPGANGLVQLQITDTLADTLTFSINTLTSGLTGSGATLTIAPSTYRCHSDGLGASWSDTTATSTFNAAQALSACEQFYGNGNCTVNGKYAYPTTVYDGSCGNPASINAWVYSAFTSSDSGNSCGTMGVTVNAGTVLRGLTEYSTTSSTCLCSPLWGQTTNLSWTSTATWN
jgi:hypothetical protein